MRNKIYPTQLFQPYQYRSLTASLNVLVLIDLTTNWPSSDVFWLLDSVPNISTLLQEYSWNSCMAYLLTRVLRFTTSSVDSSSEYPGDIFQHCEYTHEPCIEITPNVETFLFCSIKALHIILQQGMARPCPGIIPEIRAIYRTCMTASD